MNKKILGIIILLVIIIIAAIIKFVPFNKALNVSNIKYINFPEPYKISGSGGYQLDKITIDGESIPLIKVPLVTWGGYAALFAANNGIKPNKDSQFYKNGKFVVELIRDEDSKNHLQEFADWKSTRLNSSHGY